MRKVGGGAMVNNTRDGEVRGCKEERKKEIGRGGKNRREGAIERRTASRGRGDTTQ